MKTIKFLVLIFAIMIYSYSCNNTENKSLETLTSGDDSITIDASVTYDTISENFIGFAYEKTNLRATNFWIPNLIHLYANFNHPGFIRPGGGTVDRCIWESNTNPIYDTFFKIHKADIYFLYVYR